MKIGIDISQIAHEGTGVGNYYQNLVTALQKIDQKNDYVLLGYSLRKQSAFKGYSAKVFPLPPTAMDLLWNQLHTFPVENLIGTIDVFHTSDWIQPPTRAKKVTTIFDLVVFKYPETSHPKIVATQIRAWEWAKRECAAFIAISETTKKDAVEILSLPEEKIKVIPLAANLGPILPGIREKYHLDKPYILALGTKQPRKNISRLVEAFKKLGLKDIELVIAGNYGWGSEKLNCRELGYVSEEDKPALFANAKLFVYPSLYEGFGIPVLEAMSVGCPVVISNTSSLPEVGGNAAVYFDPRSVGDIAKKIEIALKTKGLKEKSLAQAAKFSWEKTARETLKIYESLA